MPESRIPVLIVGGGSVGLAAALFLAHQGVSTLTVESQAGPSIHPRATGLGPRTIEFLREIGLEEAVNAVAIDMSAGSLGKISAPTLATAELSSPPKATPTATNWADQVSPAVIRGICPQHRLDSVLLPAARERGAIIRHSTRLVSFEQDADGVTAVSPAMRTTTRSCGRTTSSPPTACTAVSATCSASVRRALAASVRRR